MPNIGRVLFMLRGTRVASRLPDVLLSGGRLDDYKYSDDFTRRFWLNEYYSTVWHELSHTSNFNRVKNEKGFWPASAYWRSLIITEIGHSDNYGVKGDSNWEQVALCEGWANYNEYRYKSNYLNGINFNRSNYNNFPYTHVNLFYDLNIIGCSIPNLEKCLTAKTIADYRNLLISIYPDLKDQITSTIKIKNYE